MMADFHHLALLQQQQQQKQKQYVEDTQKIRSSKLASSPSSPLLSVNMQELSLTPSQAVIYSSETVTALADHQQDEAPYKPFQAAPFPERTGSSKPSYLVSEEEELDLEGGDQREELELEEIFIEDIRNVTSRGAKVDAFVALHESSDDLSGVFSDDDEEDDDDLSGDGLPLMVTSMSSETAIRHNKRERLRTVRKLRQKSVSSTSPTPSRTLSASASSLSLPSPVRSRSMTPPPSSSLQMHMFQSQSSSLSLDGSVRSCSPHPGDSQRFKPFHEEKWNIRLKELKEYRREHGNCLVPHTFPQNPQLARWVKRQRRQYKLMSEGRASTMTNERLQVLNEIGFVWDSHEACWHEKLQELSAYRSRVGNCLVPSNYKANPQLATWVKCQRRQYKLYWEGRASAMTPERIVHLEKIGFEWEIRSNNANVDRSDYLMLSQAISNL